jgi:hypothetical protein
MSNNPHSTLHATDLRQATPATIIPVIPFRSSNTRSSSTSLLVSSSVDNSQTYGCHTHVRSSVFDKHCQVQSSRPAHGFRPSDAKNIISKRQILNDLKQLDQQTTNNMKRELKPTVTPTTKHFTTNA